MRSPACESEHSDGKRFARPASPTVFGASRTRGKVRGHTRGRSFPANGRGHRCAAQRVEARTGMTTDSASTEATRWPPLAKSVERTGERPVSSGLGSVVVAGVRANRSGL